jgi:hypothetical protein
MELRKRVQVPLQGEGDDDHLSRALDEVMMDLDALTEASEKESSVSVSELRSASKLANEPMREGLLDKKTNNVCDGLIPDWCLCQKKWKLNRYIVVLGMHMYRFKDDNSTALKGVPIPVTSTSTKKLKFVSENHPRNEIEEPFCFEVSTLRKRYVFRAANDEEANSWVQFINQRKALGHKQKLGHAKSHPAIAKLDSAAKIMYQDRMKREEEDSEEMRRQADSLLRTGSTMNPMQVSSSFK